MSGLALVPSCCAPTYGWFLAACASWSVAMGISGAAPAAYAARHRPPGMNAAAVGSYRMLADLGYVVGPIALGLAADLAGIDATLAGTAVLLVAVALLFAARARDVPRRPLLSRRATCVVRDGTDTRVGSSSRPAPAGPRARTRPASDRGEVARCRTADRASAGGRRSSCPPPGSTAWCQW